MDAWKKAEVLTHVSRQYVSPSQVRMWLRCGESYRMRYVDGIKIKPSAAMASGTGVHAGAAARHIVRRDRDIELPVEDIVGLSVASYDAAINEGFEPTPGRAVADETGEARDATVAMARAFAEHVAPQIMRPTHVEERIEVTFPQLSRPVLGIIDVAHEPLVPFAGPAVVIEDLKTGRKKRSQQSVDVDRQLGIYALLWRAAGHGRARLGIRQIVQGAKGCATHWLETSRDAEQLEKLIGTIDYVLRQIDAGNFPPAPEEAWWCSQDQCGYWSRCRYV